MAISSGFQECRDRPELSPVVRIVLSDHEISWNGQPSLLRDIDSAVVDLNKFKPRPVLLLETDRTIDENHFKNVINKIGADFQCGRDDWCCVKINSAFEQQVFPGTLY
jgi:biopolymer transport protein ExbD